MVRCGPDIPILRLEIEPVSLSFESILWFLWIKFPISSSWPDVRVTRSKRKDSVSNLSSPTQCHQLPSRSSARGESHARFWLVESLSRISTQEASSQLQFARDCSHNSFFMSKNFYEIVLFLSGKVTELSFVLWQWNIVLFCFLSDSRFPDFLLQIYFC